MTIMAQCPNCSATLRVKPDLAGKRVKCPRCSHAFVVAGTASQSTALRKFKYRGIFNGRTEWGEVEAVTEASALEQLKRNGIDVEELNGRQIATPKPRPVQPAPVMSRDEIRNGYESFLATCEADFQKEVNMMGHPLTGAMLTAIMQSDYADLKPRAKPFLEALPTIKRQLGGGYT